MKIHFLMMLAVLGLALPQMLFSQEPARLTEYQPVIEKFFATIGEGRGDLAASDLFETNQWKAEKQDELKDVKLKLSSFIDLGGKYLGYKIIQLHPITERLHYLKVIVYFQKRPILFTFTFYKPENNWQFMNLSMAMDSASYIPELIKDEQPH